MTASAPLVIAHRTCALDAPENSVEGVRRADELGADLVELDVRLTRDGVPVLMHDASPRRTAGGRLPVRRVTASRLRRLRLVNGEPIPTFAEALAALPPRLGIAVDVKVAGAIEATVAEVRNQNLQPRTLIWSRHPSVVRYAADHEPTIEPGLLRDARSAPGLALFLMTARACRARAISAHWHAVTPRLATSTARHGLALYSWCEQPDPDPVKLALLGGIVTDWPREARAVIASIRTEG